MQCTYSFAPNYCFQTFFSILNFAILFKFNFIKKIPKNKLLFLTKVLMYYVV